MQVGELIELLGRFPAGMDVLVSEPFDGVMEHIIAVESGSVNGNVVFLKIDEVGCLYDALGLGDPQEAPTVYQKPQIIKFAETVPLEEVVARTKKSAKSEAPAEIDPPVQRPASRSRKAPDPDAPPPRPVGRPRKIPSLSDALRAAR